MRGMESLVNTTLKDNDSSLTPNNPREKQKTQKQSTKYYSAATGSQLCFPGETDAIPGGGGEKRLPILPF
jgi:hypothetical protein